MRSGELSGCEDRAMRYVDTVTGSRISKIGLGCWQFGSREWGYGKDYAQNEAQALVQRALDLGVNLIDTAEIYGFGASERIVGEALRDRRDEAYVATKIFPVAPFPAVVQQRAVASAGRLGVRSLDLYQVHQPNPVVPDTQTMQGMRTLQDIGLVRDVGVSNYSLERWQAAERALGRPVLSNQVQFSLVARSPLRDLLPYAAQQDRVVIAYSPVAQGLLAAKYDASNPPSGAVRRANPLFLPVNLERAQPLLDVLREVAAAHDATPAQVALAWVIHPPRVVAIPGASRIEQVEANAAAAEIELAEDEYNALTGAAVRFRPLTGMSAMPRLLAARFGR